MAVWQHILPGFCGSLAMFSKCRILKIGLFTNAAYGAFHSGADVRSKVRRKSGLAFTVIGRFATAFALALQGRCGGFLRKRAKFSGSSAAPDGGSLLPEKSVIFRWRHSWTAPGRRGRSRRSPSRTCWASRNPQSFRPGRDNIFRKFPDRAGIPW